MHDTTVARRELIKASLGTGLALSIPAVLTPRRSVAAPPVRPLAEWERIFLGMWNAKHDKYLAQSLSGDSYHHYYLAEAIDGHVAMYQATGNTRYLDRALLYVNNVIATAKRSRDLPASQFKRDEPGWGDKFGWGAYNEKYKGTEEPLYEVHMWRYVTRMLRLMKADRSHHETYSRILDFAKSNIFDKWHMRGPNRHVYRGVTHMTSHFGYISLDLSRLIPNDGRFIRVVDNINHDLPTRPGWGLRNQIVDHPALPRGYWWDMWWGKFDRPGDDTAHAGGDVAFVVESEELGHEWRRDDIERLIDTLERVVWPKAAALPTKYLDGGGPLTGGINDGWIKLGRYSADLQKRLESYNRARTVQLYGNCALNAKFLTADRTRHR